MTETPQEKSNARFSWFTEASIPAKISFAIGGVVAVFVVALLLSLILALLGDSQGVANTVNIIRDLFLILLAMLGILVGLAFIVMILQIAALFNLFQNEIRPIIQRLQDAASTVKGTAEFLSENAAAPVIESQAWIAGIGTFLREVVRLRQTAQPSENEREPQSHVQDTETT